MTTATKRLTTGCRVVVQGGVNHGKAGEVIGTAGSCVRVRLDGGRTLQLARSALRRIGGAA